VRLLDVHIMMVGFVSPSMLVKNLPERESTVSSSYATGVCKGACQVASSDIRKARLRATAYSSIEKS
jgi:hypothetical protein